jgi:hypothetical protein
MKTKIIAVVLAALLGFLSAAAQGQTTPRKIEFTNVRDHLDEYNKRLGDRFIVTNVPLTGEAVYDKVNKIYSLRAGDRSDYGYYYNFYTSPALKKSLLERLTSGDVTVVLYCTLIDFISGQESISRSLFITKVEAFDNDEKLVWTVVGPQPVKLKLPG